VRNSLRLGTQIWKKENNIKMSLREIGCEDGTGSGSCPIAGFGISDFC
jgi:hypothetical protein